MQRVNRPKGGLLNAYLRWLPVPIHKQLDFLFRHIQSDWRRLPLSSILSRLLGDSGSSSLETRPAQPRVDYGLRALTLDDKPVPEADASRIAALALEDIDRYLQFYFFPSFYCIAFISHVYNISQLLWCL